MAHPQKKKRRAPRSAPLPVSAMDDRSLARKAHLWAKLLSGRADVLLEGQGDSLIEAAVSGEPFAIKQPFGTKTGPEPQKVSIRSWVAHIVDLLESSKLQRGMDKQHEAERVLQIKADLLKCLDYCKRLYNARKPRKPQRSAEEETWSKYEADKESAKAQARAAFGRLLSAAIPFPITKKIRQTAEKDLETVLLDRHEGGHSSPQEAATAVIQKVLLKYLGKKVSEDFIRQGASYVAETMRPSHEIQVALARERQDPDHRLRDEIEAQKRRLAAQPDVWWELRLRPAESAPAEPSQSPPSLSAETDPKSA